MKDNRKIAIYLRLSIEDDTSDSKTSTEQWESNSISNQRELLLDYISHDTELRERELAEFCDDGFSGTSMDRPGMQELLKQVRQSRIGCILVKDLSRFARDYIELGDYLNQIFPFLGVRFIAVNDHYDSREHEGSTIPLDTAFQTLLYDLYSKDVSVKVKTSIQNKCAKGEYVFGQVPFGYAKSETEKNAVVVNEREAEIVRHIFSLAEKGMSSTQIAKELMEEQTPTVTQMRYPERAKAGEHRKWSGTAVRGILNNRFYLGEMAYGKTVRKCVGSKTGTAVPREEWKVLPNHHEPLITPEVFALVSAFRPKRSARRKNAALQNREKHPLTGKIYCGGCGCAMSYKPQSSNGGMPSHFGCRKHSLPQIPDCCTYFRADILEEIVLTEIGRELMCRGDLKKQRESLEPFRKQEWNRRKKELCHDRIQYRHLQTERDTLYESYAVKQIGAGEYRSRADRIASQMEELSCKIEETELAFSRLTEEYRQPKPDRKMKKLTQEAVDVFIQKVMIYRDKRVEIQWNYTFGDFG
ncbi:MAG: recombinase family protein [Lachnospiraceae bacterium]|nr:recombinase family protein [Lachnospiraceae bacterium]